MLIASGFTHNRYLIVKVEHILFYTTLFSWGYFLRKRVWLALFFLILLTKHRERDIVKCHYDNQTFSLKKVVFELHHFVNLVISEAVLGSVTNRAENENSEQEDINFMRYVSERDTQHISDVKEVQQLCLC